MAQQDVARRGDRWSIGPPRDSTTTVLRVAETDLTDIQQYG